jgi:ABC-type multidrug transport system fused ATPase/permease subunit
MFVSNQAFSFLGYFSNKRILALLAELEYYLSKNLQEKMVSLDLNYHERENTGGKISKIQRGILKINDLSANLFWDVVPTTFQVIFTGVALFWVDYRFGMAICFFIPVFVFLTLRINRILYPARKKRFDDQDKAAGILTQSIININTVKSFVQEKRETRNFEEVVGNIKENGIREFRRLFRYDLRRNLVIDLGRAFILIFGIFLVSKGSMTIGTLVFVFTISERSLVSLYRISRLYDRIMESGEAIEGIYKLLQEKSEIKSPKNGLKPKTLEGEIEFKNATFIYSESRIRALDRVSFKIGSGATTALVGPSGGGKTTVARLVYRHYDPTEGKIFLDGKNLKEYDIYSFRKFLAIVPQEVEIFNTSVKDNIAYARPEASFKEIQSAARIANAEEFIKELKDGYETLVGERGIKLSGGQRQRIGIARAILANPRILIFDEATSNLDSHSERLIQEAMEKIRKNRTVIIIAHRLSTIKKADKIIVLEKGRVAEEGSHTELSRSKGGLYQKLLELQEMGDVE